MNTQLTDKIINESDEFMRKNGYYPNAVYLSEWQIRKLQSEISADLMPTANERIPPIFTFAGMKLIVSPNDGPHFVNYE